MRVNSRAVGRIALGMLFAYFNVLFKIQTIESNNFMFFLCLKEIILLFAHCAYLVFAYNMLTILFVACRPYCVNRFEGSDEDLEVFIDVLYGTSSGSQPCRLYPDWIWKLLDKHVILLVNYYPNTFNC